MKTEHRKPKKTFVAWIDTNKGMQSGYDVAQVAPDRLQIWSINPFISCMKYGDIIEVEPDGDGYKLKRVVERSRFMCVEFGLSGNFAESTELRQYCKRIEELGGAWERYSQGWLIVYVPRDGDFDPRKEMRKISKKFQS